MIGADARRAIESSLGTTLGEVSPCSGGDINQAHRVTTNDGRTLFVKTNPGQPAELFACEAAGLDWLRHAEALPLPRVVAVSDRKAAVGFLVLDYLAPRARAGDFDERLGRGLATLHRAGAPRFGLEYDNYIATLRQDNAMAAGAGAANEAREQCATSWPAFYGECRLRPQVRLAIDSQVAPPSWAQRFDALIARLPQLVAATETPARLHGDLWSGNVYVAADGGPCLIDPAVYGGHREVDLAMLALFGGLSDTVLSAYAESYPLAPGFDERVGLYQLYPLLVHVNLFGGSYLSSVERILAQLLS